MPLMILGWFLILSSIALSALLVLQLRPSELQTAKFDLETWLRPASWRLDRAFRGTAGTLVVTAIAFLLVAGIGAASSYVKPQEKTDAAQSDDEILAQLNDYAQSIGHKKQAPAAVDEKLPDVNTMIDRLAARLEDAPQDVNGWRMLGWSYFNVGSYEKAAAAYAKAMALDPTSTELRTAYEEAKAKGSEAGDAATAPSSQTATTSPDGDEARAAAETKSQAIPPHETDAAIRSMVDRLTDRLKSSPRDVEGWTRLMRSRVVLGEKDVAASALRTALDVFKDDSVASARIAEAAGELDLKAE